MDPEQIIGQLIGGFFGGKQARRRGGISVPGLAGYGAGRRGRGLLNAGTLLTVGGLIWGALETMQQQANAPGVPPTGTTPPSAPPRGVMGAGGPGAVAPPPLPPIPATGTAVPPVPDVPVPPSLLPLVQLAVSAARADGELGDDELALIRARASELGAAGLVDAELQARRSLDAITSAFVTPEQRQMAYALAYAVVRGEGDISPGERMYLTQLSRALALPSDEVERIERETLADGPTP